jgi:S-formylglutathione hydrolase FrmB
MATVLPILRPPDAGRAPWEASSTRVIDKPSIPAPAGGRRYLLFVGAPVLAVLIAIGLLGALRYVRNYWVYRGFPPPRDPAFVNQTGTTLNLYVKSPALDGRSQLVQVYLPPGYNDHPTARYPVFYLLHGFPGRPGAFLLTLRMGILEDVYYAQHRMTRPPILVMPFGSTSTFTDEEWANGIHRGNGWETFVARDVVRAIDQRYRTIRSGAGRAIGGLSEGGYGALNIGLHHPGEFGVLESWSGYERADNVSAIFGGHERLLAQNSPLLQLRKAAPVLRRAHTYIWFYSGVKDPVTAQNRTFAAKLAGARIPHKFFVTGGGHNWALWRLEASPALVAAYAHLGR